ncbi:hypothetical protein [Fulvivirga lutimaris]|uniref:hypothetical protein n=1 Tax=Fulvivirga lutimaris TaxID=1819566 RepID=UPI0012BB8F3C|nr:hypothetical protein [Fulvivirga lutimaris]MTI41159.1 hypothetical protein [Fulvivirga lutimaris]
MTTPFDLMPDNARVWVYQSQRALTAAEQETITKNTNAFLEQWAAHGKELKTSFEIRDDRFLIVAVDESFNHATGCSIDASVAFMKAIDAEYQLDLFDRTKIAFIFNGQIVIESLSTLKAKVENGEIPSSAVLVNNSVSSKKELDEDWKQPVLKSWASRYFKTLQQN